MNSLSHEKRSFTHGSFYCEYTLVRQNRKTLSITVLPDSSILVKVPLEATQSRINGFLRKKWMWIQSSRTYFLKFKKTSKVKEYVSGESIYYLGKQYQLLIKRASISSVQLQNGSLIVKTILPNDRIHKKRIISNWFAKQSRRVFEERLNEIFPSFMYTQKPRLEIKQMKLRWGSYTVNGNILLNPKLIHMSKRAIDYVITHELCHMSIKNHDKKFFSMLESKFPGWKKVKHILESKGVEIE